MNNIVNIMKFRLFIVILSVFSFSFPTHAFVSETKDLFEALGEVSEQIDEKNASKRLIALNKIARGLEGLSKLGPTFSVIGAGLDLYKLFSGEEDDTAKILSAIDDVKGQITELDNKMTRLNQRQFVLIQKLNFESDISKNFTAIDNTFETWQISQRTGNPDIGMTTAMRNWDDLRNDAKSIADYCSGANKKQNMFKVLEKAYFGDITITTSWATFAIFRIAEAQMIDAYLFRMKAEKDLVAVGGKLSNEIREDIQNRAIRQAVQKYDVLLSKCQVGLSQSLARINKDIKSNSKNYIQNVFFDQFFITTPEIIGPSLRSKYPQKHWIYASYEPVWGFKNHLVHGNNFYTFFRKDVQPVKRNIVVHFFTPKEEMDNSLSLIKLQGAGAELNMMCERSDCVATATSIKQPKDGSFKAYKNQGCVLWGNAGQVDEPRCVSYDDDYDIRLVLPNLKNPSPFVLIGRNSTSTVDWWASSKSMSTYWNFGFDLWSIQSF